MPNRDNKTASQKGIPIRSRLVFNYVYVKRQAERHNFMRTSGSTLQRNNPRYVIIHTCRFGVFMFKKGS